MENNLPLSEVLKSKLIEWCLNSTSHGIPNIVRSKTLFQKIMWILCFLASFSYCLSLIIQSFINYYNYPVTLQMSNVQDLPGKSLFILICIKTAELN
jgi:hypothetical protein